MNILLISANIASTPHEVYPIGLSMVAAALHNAGHRVFQFDFLQHGKSIDKLILTVEHFNPDLIGISIRNIDNVNLVHELHYIHPVKTIAQTLKAQTRALIVLGGSGFSLMPEEILNDVPADYGISGEGESAMVEFAAAMEKGLLPDTKLIRSRSNLCGNDIPSARYDAAIMHYYLASGRTGSVQTKRGCPHGCVYCAYPSLEGKTIRCRDTKAVVDDIQTLTKHFNAKFIFFTDSVFNDDEGRYLYIIREMRRRHIVVPWTAFFRPSGLNDEKVLMMKQTGLAAAEIGADAPTDTTLRGLGKSFSFDDVVECNDLFARNDISSSNYFMFGCPGETQNTVDEGIENITKLQNTVSFIFMGIRIIKATPLANIAISEGLLTPNQNLLTPVYYIAPGLDRRWLEKTLRDAFKGTKRCVFPPDSLDRSLQLMHSLGYAGSIWDILIPKKEKSNRRRGTVKKSPAA